MLPINISMCKFLLKNNSVTSYLCMYVLKINKKRIAITVIIKYWCIFLKCYFLKYRYVAEPKKKIYIFNVNYFMIFVLQLILKRVVKNILINKKIYKILKILFNCLKTYFKLFILNFLIRLSWIVFIIILFLYKFTINLFSFN